eukprot:g5724.t1
MILTLCYLVCLLAVFFQIAKIIRGKHRLNSLQFYFFLLCVVWLLCRVILWTKYCFSDTWSELSISMLYFLPQPLIFATFSLLVLLYAEVLAKKKATIRLRNAQSIVYLVVNVSFLIVSFGLALTSGMSTIKNQPWLETIHLIFAGVIFVVLSAALAFYGYRLAMARGAGSLRAVAPQLNSWAPRMFMGLNFLISLVFASRGIYTFGSAAGAWGIMQDSGGLNFNGDHPLLVPAAFVVYFVWEIIPTAAMLMVTWNIATGQRSSAWASQAKERLTDAASDYHYGDRMNYGGYHGGGGGGGGGDDDGDGASAKAKTTA